MSWSAGALLGGLGKLLDFFSGERRHQQALAQTAQHRQEQAVIDAVRRFADHLCQSGFNANVNRQFLESLTADMPDADVEKVARGAFPQAPHLAGWFEGAGGMDRFLVHMGIRDGD